MSSSRERGLVRWRTGLVPLLLATTLLAAACGSKDDDSSGSAGSGGSTSAAVSQAKTDLAKYEQRPTSIALDTPVGADIPDGKTVDFIPCGPGCAFAGPIFQKAGDLLGWKVNILNNDGSTEGIQGAWDQIFRDKPDGVVYIGLPRAAQAQDLSRAADAGIFVSACCTADTVGDGIDYLINDQDFSKTYGPLYGAWAIANAESLPASFLVVTVPEFTTTQVYADAAKADITQRCPDCKVDNLSVPLSSLQTTAPNLVVSYLRSHPDVKRVLLTTDSIGVGLPAALKAAGLDDVQFFGEGATPTNFAYIAAGQQAGSIVFPYYEDLFGMMDAIARHEAGVDVIPGYHAPLWIVTKDNIPSVKEIFPVVENVEDHFAELWGKSS